RKDLGLDDPLAMQYGRYLWRLAHGDLGRSYLTGRRVAEVIGERLRATSLLGLSIPTFWLGNVLIYFFGYRLRWLPLGGYGTLRHLVLPAATLAIVEL